jgi:Ca2+-binding EF-hand superfamily protein
MIKLINKIYYESKRKDIEIKYKCLFETIDLDWNGYVHLQKMKNKELDKISKHFNK